MKKLKRMIKDKFDNPNMDIALIYKDFHYGLNVKLYETSSKSRFKVAWGTYKELNRATREDIIKQLEGKKYMY